MPRNSSNDNNDDDGNDNDDDNNKCTVAEIYQNMFLIDLQQNKKKAKKVHWNVFPIVQAVDTSLVTYKYGKKTRYKEKGGECVTGDDDGFLWRR